MSDTGPSHHAVVWIDHKKADIIRFDRNSDMETVVRHKDAPRTIHHKAGTAGPGHIAEDPHYLASVAEALKPAQEILIVGPGEVKLELRAWLEKHAPDIAKRVVGVEAADHPTDGELLAHARKYFIGADRMRKP
jgi:hypothetical protein